MDTTYLIVPGFGNSDINHWQTYFERQLPNCTRIEQKSWDKPLCIDWVKTINEKINNHNTESVILISHSLGGIAIAHWANHYNTIIKGAFIVAPPDIENPYLDLSLDSFTPIPLAKFPFRSIVVGSTNDNWATKQRTKTFAENWGSELIFIGDAGHINTNSGYGEWKEGLALLKAL
jgi:predicted alpha/beta hydrolase family esterase